MDQEVTPEVRKLIEEIIRAYHTTRLDKDFVPHIFGKPYVKSALATAEADIAALRALVFQQGENAAKAATEYAENMAALRAENARLREALGKLEAANEALCATRSQETYSRMIHRDGAHDALIALDEARRNARAALTGARDHD